MAVSFDKGETMWKRVVLNGPVLFLGAFPTLLLAAQEKQDPGQLVRGREPAHRVLQAPDADGYFRSVTFSPDGKLLAGGPSQGDKVFVWDVATGKLRTRLQFPQPNYEYYLVFSADCRTLISTGREDEMIRFWDVATGKQIREVKRQSHRFFALAPGGLRIAESGPKLARGLKVMETAKGTVKWENKDPSCRGCAFSPDGKILATHGRDGEITLWNSDSGAKIRTLREEDPFGMVAFTFVVFLPTANIWP
jgi:WD40 repeat protein